MIEGLYFITPGGTDAQVVASTEAALHGGARVIQYRDKERGAAAQAALGRRIGALCRAAGAIFLVNDSAVLARDCQADGVHLGQGDGSVAAARALLGTEKLIGISTRTVDQARRAAADGADYIGLGAIFPTGSKSDAELVGVERLRQVRQAVALPIVAIGGIGYGNAGEVIDAGADAVAVISAVAADPQPVLAARELALLFNRKRPAAACRVLTVAGSDSGGGAGIQADLKTITLLGAFGMSAITVLTAQNTRGVDGVFPAPAAFVRRQAELVLDDIGADTVKTGMLYAADIVESVAELLARYGLAAVVDPVMIAKGGAPLLREEAMAALRERLLPQTFLLTPNLPEAEALTGRGIATLEEMEAAARELHALGARHVLVKGGHRTGDATDLLLCGGTLYRLPGERVPTANTHGTGCSYAAALATLLARGEALPAAAQRAKRFIDAAIRNGVPLGSGHGPINHAAGARAVLSDEC
ncbi:MAG: bifunctional hydroxymethylpyrimidine kinase/phosphomethylpyrimidine kinase [Deltaproteobacteria bacterium]|nr:MAG: bifunctional hydroxymethylpyrimidine kinase/phosphomethylpyrimidine kinase [Deltaproteobacteria bacterium]